MWRLIAVPIAEALKKAAPEVLRSAAVRLGTLTRTSVPASVEGILAAAKNYVQENPIKATLVVSALIEGGLNMALDVVERAFEGSGEDPTVRAVIEQIREKQMERLRQITGDGDPGTVHGVAPDQLNENAAVVTLAIARIKQGARLFGSVDAFRQAREAILLVEEEDFAIYDQVVAQR